MKDTTLDKQVWVRVSEETHTALKEKCDKNGIKISALIRILIMKYLEEEIKL
jgi:predicted DNA binding CopG/RHH family protein